jgi:hypothetical protein
MEVLADDELDDISMAVTFDEAGDKGLFKRAELRAVAAVALTRPLFGGGDVAEAGSAGRIMPQIPRAGPHGICEYLQRHWLLERPCRDQLLLQ